MTGTVGAFCLQQPPPAGCGRRGCQAETRTAAIARHRHAEWTRHVRLTEAASSRQLISDCFSYMGMSGLLQLVGLLLGLLVVIGAVVVGYGMAAYNQLVARRNRVREGWRGLEAVLQQRHDLAAGMVETVEHQAPCETSVLEAVRQAREACLAEPQATAARARAEAALTTALGRLASVAERDPMRSSTTDHRQLRDELEALEGDLEKTLKAYQRAVQRLNSLVERFPSNIIAGLFDFTPVDDFAPIDDFEGVEQG
jgi:LemA protein